MATATRQTNKMGKAVRRPAGKVAAVKKVAGKKVAGKKIGGNKLAGKRAPAAETSDERRPRAHVATDPEIVTLLNAVDDSRLWPATKMAIELVLLTGARPSDVRLATWGEFDLGQAIWTIPAGRLKATQAFTVHLSPQALALLRRARSHQTHTAEEPEPQDADVPIFKGAKGNAMEKTAVARALRRLAKRTEAHGGAKLAPHDLRRTFRALLLRLGMTPEVADGCMGHAGAPADQLTAAWNGVGAHIQAIRAGQG